MAKFLPLNAMSNNDRTSVAQSREHRLLLDLEAMAAPNRGVRFGVKADAPPVQLPKPDGTSIVAWSLELII